MTEAITSGMKFKGALKNTKKKDKYFNAIFKKIKINLKISMVNKILKKLNKTGSDSALA